MHRTPTFRLVFFCLNLHAEDKSVPPDRIEIFQDESRLFFVESTDYYELDPEIVLLTPKGTSFVEIKGLQPGETVVYYHLGGEFRALLVTVKSKAGGQYDVERKELIMPTYIGEGSLHTYQLLFNTFFSKDNYMENRSYVHDFRFSFPILGGRFKQHFNLSDGMDQPIDLTTYDVSFTDQFHNFEGGDTGVSLSFLPTPVAATFPLRGFKAEFNDIFYNQLRDTNVGISLFAGYSSSDYFDVILVNPNSERVYGLNVGYDNTKSKDKMSFSVFNFQKKEEDVSKLGLIYQGQLTFASRLKIENAFLRGQDANGIYISPEYKGEKSTVSAFYRFSGREFEFPNDVYLVNDFQSYGVGLSERVKNDNVLLAQSFSNTTSRNPTSADVPVSQSQSGNMLVFWHRNDKSEVSTNYSLSKTFSESETDGIVADSLDNQLNVLHRYLVNENNAWIFQVSGLYGHNAIATDNLRGELSTQWQMKYRNLNTLFGFSSDVDSFLGGNDESVAQYAANARGFVSAQYTANYFNLGSILFLARTSSVSSTRYTLSGMMNMVVVPNVAHQLSLGISPSLTLGENLLDSLNVGASVSYTFNFGSAVKTKPLFKTLINKFRRASISGYVFLDKNGNMKCDGVDTRYGGITITLADESGETKSIKTDDNGYYKFTGLNYGNQIVRMTYEKVPGNIVFQTDSERNVLIDEEIKVHQVNFVFSPKTATIQGIAYLDFDKNDAYNSDQDQSVGRMRVYLEHEDGTSQATRTNSDGTYVFENVNFGNVSITMEEMDIADDVQFKKVTWKMKIAEITEYTADFVGHMTFLLVGVVFVDQNGDGRLNVGEKGVRNISVTAYKTSSNKTNEKGEFMLTGLRPSKFTINLSGIPNEYYVSDISRLDVNITIDESVKNIYIPVKKK